MQKARILLILGFWVMILSYLGFPYSWKDTLFTLTGLIIIYLSYLFYSDIKKEKQQTFDSFKENSNFDEKGI
ncbi:MAG: hypothetical protein WCP17_01700 [bacterium]